LLGRPSTATSSPYDAPTTLPVPSLRRLAVLEPLASKLRFLSPDGFRIVLGSAGGAPGAVAGYSRTLERVRSEMMELASSDENRQVGSLSSKSKLTSSLPFRPQFRSTMSHRKYEHPRYAPFLHLRRNQREKDGRADLFVVVSSFPLPCSPFLPLPIPSHSPLRPSRWSVAVPSGSCPASARPATVERRSPSPRSVATLSLLGAGD
jgi:hypothetical protein